MVCSKCKKQDLMVRASINHLFCCYEGELENLIKVAYVILNKLKSYDIDLTDGVWYWSQILIDIIKRLYSQKKSFSEYLNVEIGETLLVDEIDTNRVKLRNRKGGWNHIENQFNILKRRFRIFRILENALLNDDVDGQQIVEKWRNWKSGLEKQVEDMENSNCPRRYLDQRKHQLVH